MFCKHRDRKTAMQNMIHQLIFYKEGAVKTFFPTVNFLQLCLCQPHANTWSQPYFQFSTSLPLPLWRDGWHMCDPCSLFHPSISQAKSEVLCHTCRKEAQQESTDLRLTHYGFLLVSYTKCVSNCLFYVRCKIKWNVWNHY